MSVIAPASTLREILAHYSAEFAADGGTDISPQHLIPILQDIQERDGYLTEEALRELARVSDISENEIYGVATFYAQFRFKPPAKHTIRVCEGTACHVRGGRQVMDEFHHRLGVRTGETTDDGEYELQRIACIGCCALAPTVTVDGEVHARVTPTKVRSIVAR
jgi:NADH:ubiquinone oxidoreductase subunit E